MAKRKLTLRQAKLMKARLAGATLEEAAHKAGYACKQSAWMAEQAIAKCMRKVMDERGLTDEGLVDNYLLPLMRAQETKFFARDGIVMDKRTVAALDIRMRALELAGKWRGLGKDSRGDEQAETPAVTINLAVLDRATAEKLVAAITGGGGPDLLDAELHKDS